MVTTPQLQAPFPWFGGKSRACGEVWRRFGDVPNYVEPFFGSGAVLLGRPSDPRTETINDINGYVVNFWRAVQYQPEETAKAADQPVFESDLHAWHCWLVERKDSLRAKLEGNPEWCDPLIAGRWCWGLCCWIGSGWCETDGPWWPDENGEFQKDDAGRGVTRQLPHLGRSRGVTRQLPVQSWFAALSARLSRVRVCCGDWSRVCGDAVLTFHGGIPAAVFLDPPYLHSVGRADDLYGEHDDGEVAHAVRDWCLERTDDKRYRIALCGYEGEHTMPGWDCWHWKTKGGYSSRSSHGNENANRERIWFSPGCLSDRRLF